MGFKLCSRILANGQGDTWSSWCNVLSCWRHRYVQASLQWVCDSPPSVQFSSVAQLCLTLCDPIDCSTPGFPVYHQCPELAQTHIHRVGDTIQPPHALSSPLLLPSVFPSIRVFSNESALCVRWPKYWSFSFNISPSSEHSGLISFRMYCLRN